MGRIRATLHGSQLRGGSGQLTLEEKAALAAKYGYPGLDFSLAEARAYEGGSEGVKALLSKHELEASTVGGVFGASLTDATDGQFEEALGNVASHAAEVVALGGSRSGIGVACRADRPKDVLWPRAVERLRRLDGALEGTGVRLGMEFLGVKTLRLEKAYAFVQSMVEANRLLDDARARNVGLTLDSYHWYSGEDTLETIRQTPGERIVLLHVNDAKDLPPHELLDADRVLPGEGIIPLADWVRAISETGFDGFIALEVLGPRIAGMPPEECARVGRERMTRIMESAGLSGVFK
jgi:sugar phosphate isomerase/epimerase